MGSILSRSLRERRFLILGMSGAGKTTLLYKLRLGEVQNHVGHIGFNWENVQYKDMNFVCWDIGICATGPAYKHKYKDMYRNTVAVIFVIDSSYSDWFEETKIEFQRILHDEYLHNFVLLVFANKQDVLGAASVEEITNLLELNSIRGINWNIQGSSFLNGDGIYEGLEWLKKALDNETIVKKNWLCL